MKTFSEETPPTPCWGCSYVCLSHFSKEIPTYVTRRHMKLCKIVRVLCVIAPLNRGINICWWLGFYAFVEKGNISVEGKCKSKMFKTQTIHGVRRFYTTSH